MLTFLPSISQTLCFLFRLPALPQLAMSEFTGGLSGSGGRGGHHHGSYNDPRISSSATGLHLPPDALSQSQIDEILKRRAAAKFRGGR